MKKRAVKRQPKPLTARKPPGAQRFIGDTWLPLACGCYRTKPCRNPE